MLFRNEKKSTGYEFLIVGLGNPGKKYEMTRHNAGFLALDLLAIEENVDIKKLKFHALVGDVQIDGHRCLLMKPQTMMNLSGEAIAEAANFYKIKPENIVVLFDDVCLDVGKTRIRRKGSAGGHNGIKNIIACLGTEVFPRVKIGVGQKPHPDYDMIDWVLGHIPKALEPELKSALENAVCAARLIVCGKTDEAMNKYNS